MRREERSGERKIDCVSGSSLATTFLRKKFSGMSEVATETLASGPEPQRVLLQGGRGFM